VSVADVVSQFGCLPNAVKSPGKAYVISTPLFLFHVFYVYVLPIGVIKNDDHDRQLVCKSKADT